MSVTLFRSATVASAIALGLISGAASYSSDAMAQRVATSHVIKIVVPFTPGTGADTLARSLGPILTERLGKPVVVENRPGASGSIGTNAVATAAPDGNTLLITADTLITNLHFQDHVSYDPFKDLVPVGQLATVAFALMVNPSFPAKDLSEAIAVLKAAPGKYTYGSPGLGTPQHIGMELLQASTGTSMLHVPYKGSAGAVTDVIGGQIDMMMVPLHFALPHAEAGKVRVLGVAQPDRVKFAPDIPTFEEQGVTGANLDTAWVGLFAPAGTSPEIIDTLYSEVTEALASSEVASVIEKQGLTAQPQPAAMLATTMQSDYKRWGELAQIVKRKMEQEQK